LTASIPVDQRVAVWHRAIGVLLDEGYVPDVLNEAACYISAKMRADIVAGSLAGTMAIVSIPPDGTLRLQVSGAGLYTSQDELTRDVATVQNRLLAEILNRPIPAPTTKP
jgi:hypothetical protein